MEYAVHHCADSLVIKVLVLQKDKKLTLRFLQSLQTLHFGARVCYERTVKTKDFFFNEFNDIAADLHVAAIPPWMAACSLVIISADEKYIM